MQKIDFQDVSFLIPVRIEYPDRLENLEIIVRYLTMSFNAEILIMEVDKESNTSQFVKNTTKYFFRFSDSMLFNRTKINNELIHLCKTSIAIIYDTDVIIAPEQLSESVDFIRTARADFSIPYDGRFLLVDYYNKRLFGNNLNIDFLRSGINLYATNTRNSVGGCFMFNVDQYEMCGMENENIEGWGHDDAERVKRLQKLGYSIYRPDGPLYHLHHSRGNNSYFFDESREIKSYETYFKTCAITREEMENEIAKWVWKD